MKKLFITIFTIWTLILPLTAQIQVEESDYTNQRVEMADTFRKEGKIYVVVAIVVTIFAGLIAYTVAIDRKVSKLEREFEKGN